MAELTPAEYKEKKQKQEQEAYTLLDEQTQKIMVNERLFAHFLDLLAAHCATSVSNTLLVQAQFSNASPELTAVATISEWQNRNISVKKDENGYYPRGIYQFVNDGYYTADNGDLCMKFKVAKGYDASQTNSPDYARQIMKAVRPIKVFINTSDIEATRNIALCNSSKIKCLVWSPEKLIDKAEDISEETGVRYIPETKTVIIRNLTRENWFARVSYEIAMGLFHQREGSEFRRDKHTFECGIIAYLLCRNAGIDVSNFTFDLSNVTKAYPDNVQFRVMLNDCLEISHDMAYRLNNKLADHNKKSKNQPACI